MAKRQLITEAYIKELYRKGKPLRIIRGSIITPSARDFIREKNIPIEQVDKLTAGHISPNIDVSRLGRLQQLKSIALGSDHGGFEAKEQIKKILEELRYDFHDYGVYSPEPVDYPDIAYKVAKAVAQGEHWRGIIIDGAGIGSCMAANKVKGIRASLCYDVTSAKNAREHNNANVLTIGGRTLGIQTIKEIINVWLNTEFGGGRHLKRIEKIHKIEDQENR